MEQKIPESFAGVEVLAKANVYFDGKVVSHTVRFGDGSKKTLGLIYPGSYHFGTGAPELMQIVAGQCRVRIDGEPDFKSYPAGTAFRVPRQLGLRHRRGFGHRRVHLLVRVSHACAFAHATKIPSGHAGAKGLLRAARCVVQRRGGGYTSHVRRKVRLNAHVLARRASPYALRSAHLDLTHRRGERAE